MSHASTAAAVRKAKESRPSDFCSNPRCLWRTSTGKPCRNHPVQPSGIPGWLPATPEPRDRGGK